MLWRFSRPYTWDYRVGKIENPTIELAVAVAASSAFPPFLSPVVLTSPTALRARLWRRSRHAPNLQRPPYTTRVVLTDGGVYDNLGLETAWKRYRTVLVSDGGGHMRDQPRPSGLAVQAYRVLDVIDNQVRSLRKRQLIDGYKADCATAPTGASAATSATTTSRLPPLPARRNADARRHLDAPRRHQPCTGAAHQLGLRDRRHRHQEVGRTRPPAAARLPLSRRRRRLKLTVHELATRPVP